MKIPNRRYILCELTCKGKWLAEHEEALKSLLTQRLRRKTKIISLNHSLFVIRINDFKETEKAEIAMSLEPWGKTLVTSGSLRNLRMTIMQYLENMTPHA